MKTTDIKNINHALELANQQGVITLEDDKGERYTLKHNPAHKPVNVDLLRKLRVKMPNITSDELVESVHKTRSAGYD